MKNRGILTFLGILLSVTIFTGCKTEKMQETESEQQNEATETVTSETEEAEILENEGDIEIVIPDDQESGGE